MTVRIEMPNASVKIKVTTGQSTPEMDRRHPTIKLGPYHLVLRKDTANR